MISAGALFFRARFVLAAVVDGSGFDDAALRLLAPAEGIIRSYK